MKRRIDPQRIVWVVYYEWLETGCPVTLRRVAEITGHTFAALRRLQKKRWPLHGQLEDIKRMSWVRYQSMGSVGHLPGYWGAGTRENFAWLPSHQLLRNQLKKDKIEYNMNITNPFTKAARTKLRFDSGSGHLTAEDLFDLSLKDLDRMGRAIRTRINERGDGGSLLDNPDNRETAAMKEDQLRFEVIKGVIDIRQTENREKKAAADKAAELQFLNGLLEKKRMDKLEGMDLSEIEARIAAIKGGETAEAPAEKTASA